MDGSGSKGAWSRGSGMLIGFALNGILLGLQYWLGLYSTTNLTTRWESFIGVQVAGLILLFGFHVCRAIWGTHLEHAKRLIELENRPLEGDIRPYLDQCGRRIESARFGGPNGESLDVTEVIRQLRRGECVHIDQYQLCGGTDPHYGRGKFLTVITSETLREGAFFMSLDEWTEGTSNIPPQSKLQIGWGRQDRQERKE